jgi:ankyrin repeat protein
MIAADAGHPGIVGLLLARGAARDLKDKDGKTALDLATDNPVRDRLRAVELKAPRGTRPSP